MADSATNSPFVPDFLERRIYRNMYFLMLMFFQGVLTISGVKILGSHITSGLGNPGGKTPEQVLEEQLAELRVVEADLMERLQLVRANQAKAERPKLKAGAGGGRSRN